MLSEIRSVNGSSPHMLLRGGAGKIPAGCGEASLQDSSFPQRESLRSL
jgi:hypothetical protein